MGAWEYRAEPAARGEPIDCGTTRTLRSNDEQGARPRLETVPSTPLGRPRKGIARRISGAGETGRGEGSRRPTLGSSATVCDASEGEVRAVVAPFREHGFLVLLRAGAILSWTFARKSDPAVGRVENVNVKEESDSASIYMRLAKLGEEGFSLHRLASIERSLARRREAERRAAGTAISIPASRTGDPWGSQAWSAGSRGHRPALDERTRAAMIAPPRTGA